MFKHIALITNSKTAEITKTVEMVVNYLQSINANFILCPYIRQLNKSLNCLDVKDKQFLAQHCDLAIAIGGDGTMLKAAHLTCLYDIPLLGINRGKLGFLADIPANITTEKMATYLQCIFAGDLIEEQRFLLHAEVIRDGKSYVEQTALNDVIVRNVSKLVELETYVDNSFLHRQRSDGLIIASPTGSTAYALSGGGSILHPSLNALALVPICPHSLTNRPIIIDGDSVTKIVFSTLEDVQSHVTCDGDIVTELVPGDHIIVQKDRKQVRLIHPADYDYFNLLRAKLHWSTEIC